MGAEDPFAMRQVTADLGRRDCRAVAGQDRIRCGELLEFGEDVLLERQLLRRRLKHEGRAFDSRRERVARCDSLQERRIVREQIRDRPQACRQRRPDFGRGFEHGNLMPCGGKEIGDAVTHQAAADYPDLLFSIWFLPITHVCLPPPWNCDVGRTLFA